MANRVSRKRIATLALLVVAFALASATAFVSQASAGGIRDWEPCPSDTAMNLVCPDGQVGVPYSIKFRAVEEPPCTPGDDFWHIIQGAAPPGLSMASEGTLSGTPTQSGTWAFWIEMKLPDTPTCNGTADTTQERVLLTIKPGVPKLTIGPESAPVGTVSSPYQLQMTANLADPKTWSLAAGSLPTGLTLGPSDGLISGTPTAAGTFTFTVHAMVSAQQTDTKSLTIVIREALAITAPAELPGSEVGVRFQIFLAASGGFGAYTWALASGALAPGIILGSKGAIAGRPTEPGDFRFTISVTDAESRVAMFSGTILVAERLAISTLAMKPGQVGKRFQMKLTSSGGIAPASWKLKKGPLPKGVRFNKATGVLLGVPKKAGRFRVAFEIRDALGVVARKTFLIRIAAAPVKKKRR